MTLAEGLPIDKKLKPFAHLGTLFDNCAYRKGGSAIYGGWVRSVRLPVPFGRATRIVYGMEKDWGTERKTVRYT
jgi:hypothetical protein